MTRMLRILQSKVNSSAATDLAAAVPPAEAASVESDFVVILAALLCALICIVGLIAVARCAWLRRPPAAATAAGASPRQQALANRGLKKKVLNSLPKFAYLAGEGTGDRWVGSSECAICLAEFAAGDEIRVLPQCGHGFHVACIDTWLGSHSSCPSCRSLLAVARCQKCGQFPAIPTAAGDTAPKAGNDDGGNAGAGAGGNCSNNNHISDFLP